MSDVGIVFGILCALASLGISLYDYLERRSKDEKTDKK